MALRYSIDSVQQLVTITGEYSDAAEWEELFRRVQADPRLRPGYSFLRDLRGASKPVDAATVVQIISVVRRYWGLLRPARAAIVTPREIDSAALVAHALADAENLPLQAFTSYETALNWLRAGEDPEEMEDE
jgi:hypothetical protein